MSGTIADMYKGSSFETLEEAIEQPTSTDHVGTIQASHKTAIRYLFRNTNHILQASYLMAGDEWKK